MPVYDIPKPCPYCGYKVNYLDSRLGDNNICPDCGNRIIYSVPLGKKDYHWGLPVPFGAMDELYKRQSNGG